MTKAWLAPLAFLYWIGVTVRNKMFDWVWLHSQEYDIPIVCVGNITVGGTGKTPFTEMLVGHLREQWNVAVLSRGYGRRTKGFVEVGVNSSFLDTGDEPKQIKLKYPDMVVAVCEKRKEGIERIREKYPETNLIILDDGFQHRHVKPWVNIILVDCGRPMYHDHMLPWGNLRDNVSQLHRADFVVVTKCPADMTAIDRRITYKSLSLYPYQELYFSSMEPGALRPIFPEGGGMEIRSQMPVIAMSGIGNPGAFRDSLSEYFTVIDELVYPDHHPYRRRDLNAMTTLLETAPAETVIVTTEKDYVKLRGSKKIPVELKEKLFYLPIQIAFYEDTMRNFLNKLDYGVRSNPEDRLIHS